MVCIEVYATGRCTKSSLILKQLHNKTQDLNFLCREPKW